MKITKDMTIFATIRSHPKAIEVFKTFNMGCGSCMGVVNETIENGARIHHADLDYLLYELNELFEQEGQ